MRMTHSITESGIMAAHFSHIPLVSQIPQQDIVLVAKPDDNEYAGEMEKIRKEVEFSKDFIVS